MHGYLRSSRDLHDMDPQANLDSDSYGISVTFSRLVRSPISTSTRPFVQVSAEIPMPPTDGFDLVAKELAQRNPKLRDVDTRSVVDLQFVRESSSLA